MSARANDSRRGCFRAILGGLLLATLVVAWSHHFRTTTTTLSRGAIDAIVDELVERHRTAMSEAGVPDARNLKWQDLRDQFVVRSVMARHASGLLMARVQIDSRLDFKGAPPPVLCYEFAARGDDAWEVTLLPSPVAFWLR